MNKVDLIKKSGLFDENYYLETYPDVKDYLEKHRGTPSDTIAHYLLFGAKEMRNPSEKFNTRYYLETYPDVEGNPLIHFILHGYKEGKRPCQPKYFLTMAACVKNEARYLEEWLCYYIYHGVEHFYLSDDESIDDTKEVLKPYIEEGYVTLYENQRKAGILQVQFYDKIVKDKRYETEWCCFFDADEFFQAKDHLKLATYLKSFPSQVSGIELNWKCFGDSFLEEYDDRLVIQRFVRHATFDWQNSGHAKSICKLIHTKATQENPHIFAYLRGILSNDKGEKIVPAPFMLGYATSLQRSWEMAWLNHYYSKTREEFELRLKRGYADKEGARIEEFSLKNQNNLYDDSMQFYVSEIEVLMQKFHHIRASIKKEENQ